jgi:prepilin-type processing-associated H-X9-DG protein
LLTYWSGITENNVPSINQTWDWMAPTAKMMGIKFDELGSETAGKHRTARWIYLTGYPAFQCPTNDVISSVFSTSPSPVKTSAKMISYSTSYFFENAYDSTNTGGFSETGQGFVNCGNYIPKVSKVGDTTIKIYMSDSAKWSNGTAAPDFNLTWNSGGSPGGHFSDPGPWDDFTRAYSNKGTGFARVYAFRHGMRKAVAYTSGGNTGSNLKASKFNAAFFDGHVETLSAFEAMNVNHWVPKGSTLGSTTGFQEFSQEAKDLYGYTAPVVVGR